MDDLRSNIERPIAFDGIMRVRTSTGILSIYTNFPSNVCIFFVSSLVCKFINYSIDSKIKEIKKFKFDKKVYNNQDEIDFLKFLSEVLIFEQFETVNDV